MDNSGKKLWITIDTEMDAGKHWEKSFPPQYTSVLQGIPQLLRPIWNKYNVHPVYFVSPEVLYSHECCNILRQEMKKGAVIGAHLHPEYIEPDSKWRENGISISNQFSNSDYTLEIEYEKIKNLTELIEEKLGVRPIWYRAGRFGADIDTIYCLEKLGYLYDSSVTPDIDWTSKGGPNHSVAPKEPYRISEENFYSVGESNIIEFPVTIQGKRWGIVGTILPDNWFFYRWLRPTHMTYLEMRILLRKLKKRKILVMMFHSMEIMINKTPYVRNKFMQKYYLWRLEKTIKYAVRNGYEV